ncbi:ROK family protein [Nakamurella aerolata]|uniref:ROK family protein n=1 Tax=Nakamurella aerolata TaxID=1656892 RepID=A0A849A9V8_9ACTN|nr:ROK family protein [Nakamurella aerolata]NNG35270.1 ROK family protein [Nakamurella aerolata]
MIAQRNPTGPARTGASEAARNRADDVVDVDPLLLPADDPDATARMSPEDYDWYTAAGLDKNDEAELRDEHFQAEHSALALVLRADQLEVAVVAGHGEVIARQVSARIDGLWDDPAAAMGELRERVAEVLHAIDVIDPLRLAGIGVAVDGQVNARTGDVSFTTADQPELPIALRDMLNEEFAVAADQSAERIRLLSTGAAVGAAEHWRGAAVGRPNALILQLDDTIEGALVLDGELLTGPTGNAGRIGHISVDPYGPECRCGGRGCLQAIAGGAAIVDWAIGHGSARKPTAHRSPGPGATVRPAAAAGAGGAARELLPHADVLGVAAAARRGDPVALATFRRAGEAIGQALAGAVTLLDLDVVVLAGALAGVGPVLFDPIADGYECYAALPYASGPRIIPAVLGADAASIGAAAGLLARGCVPQRPS